MGQPPYRTAHVAQVDIEVAYHRPPVRVPEGAGDANERHSDLVHHAGAGASEVVVGQLSRFISQVAPLSGIDIEHNLRTEFRPPRTGASCLHSVTLCHRSLKSWLTRMGRGSRSCSLDSKVFCWAIISFIPDAPLAASSRKR